VFCTLRFGLVLGSRLVFFVTVTVTVGLGMATRMYENYEVGVATLLRCMKCKTAAATRLHSKQCRFIPIVSIEE